MYKGMTSASENCSLQSWTLMDKLVFENNKVDTTVVHIINRQEIRRVQFHHMCIER